MLLFFWILDSIRLSESEAAAFCDKLENMNYSLYHLQVTKWRQHPRPISELSTIVKQIEFYLGLNRLGVTERGPWNEENNRWSLYVEDVNGYLFHTLGTRFRLLNHSCSCPTGYWCDAIANHGDLSTTYYFLRQNPALCQT